MASVAFRRLPNRGIQKVYQAVFSRMGENLPRRGVRFTAAEMTSVDAGVRGYRPRGPASRGAA